MQGHPLSFHRGRTPAAFTLVEMLVVMAMLAILAVYTVPAIKGTIRDSNLTQAGNHVDDLVNMARQSAVNHDAFTALVLVPAPPGATASGSALALFRLDSNYNWTQTSSWAFLPAGIKIYDDPTLTAGSTGTFLPVYLTGTAHVSLLGQPLTTSGANAYSAVIFNPDGSMYGDSSSSRTLYLQFQTDAAPSAAGNFTLKNYYDLVVTSDTGGAHVVRR